MLYESIKKLVQYGIDTGLTPECERIYTTNLLLDVFHEDNWEDVSCDLTDLVLKALPLPFPDMAASYRNQT